MLLECTIVEKISKKNEPYVQLRIELSKNPRVCKDVFLEDAEIAILSLQNKDT